LHLLLLLAFTSPTHKKCIVNLMFLRKQHERQQAALI